MNESPATPPMLTDREPHADGDMLKVRFPLRHPVPNDWSLGRHCELRAQVSRAGGRRHLLCAHGRRDRDHEYDIEDIVEQAIRTGMNTLSSSWRRASTSISGNRRRCSWQRRQTRQHS